MNVPEDRKYSETHEWFKVDGSVVTVGITHYATNELTDITYVELPEVGTEVRAGEPFGEVESVKATADLNSSVSGKVIEVNRALAEHPELVNEDPYGKGWMVRIEADDLAPLEALMDAKAYAEKIGQVA